MKNNTNKNLSFFDSYNNVAYIKSHDTRKKVVLREPKEAREYRLDNTSGKKIVVYTIDGGLINDNNVLKCDYGIYTEDDILYFIELKGDDYVWALKQLLSTIDILLVRPQVNVNRFNARIVLSKMRVPDIIPVEEKKLQLYVSKRGGDFIKKCRVLTDVI